MSIELLKGKRLSMKKGNTLKKLSPSASPPESLAAPPLRGIDGHKFEGIDVWNSQRSTYQNLWKKKGRTENKDKKSDEEKKIKSISPGRRPSVILRTLADSYHASLIEGNGLVSTMDIQQVTQSHGTAEVANSVIESPPNAEIAQQATKQPMLNLILGRQDPSSNFFTQQYIRMPDNGLLPQPLFSRLCLEESISSRTEIYFAMDMDPYTLELFRIWSRTGNIPLLYRRSCCDVINIGLQYTWQACWPLMNAVIAGYALGQPHFTDHVMDTLAQNVVRGVYADATTIEHLFSQDDVVPQVLLQFVVDRCIDSCIASLSCFDMSDSPPSFVDLMPQTTLRRLSCPKQVPLVPGCTYHTHKSLEDCYKRRVTLPEDRKRVRLELQREKSRRDVAEFIASHKDSGVKAMDWEDRRIKARQARFYKWDDGMKQSVSTFGVCQGRTAASPENKATEKVEPSKGTILGENDDPPTPSSALLGTAQTPGAVDEIKPRPLTRAAPPPPSDLERATAYSTPTYTVEPSPVSPFTSSCSIQSTPDSELRRAVEMLVAYEKRTSSCPGAFSESRVGSLRGTASESGKADE